LRSIAGIDASKNLSKAMMNEHSFSALDRHAMLTGCGSDDGYPWYASQMLALEAGEVIRLRMEKFAHGDADCEQEATLMVTEKILAAFEAGASFLAGTPISAIIGRYRAHVAANTKRLTAA
jgi:hypothetical protein